MWSLLPKPPIGFGSYSTSNMCEPGPKISQPPTPFQPVSSPYHLQLPSSFHTQSFYSSPTGKLFLQHPLQFLLKIQATFKQKKFCLKKQGTLSLWGAWLCLSRLIFLPGAFLLPFPLLSSKHPSFASGTCFLSSFSPAGSFLLPLNCLLNFLL